MKLFNVSWVTCITSRCKTSGGRGTFNLNLYKDWVQSSLHLSESSQQIHEWFIVSRSQVKMYVSIYGTNIITRPASLSMPCMTYLHFFLLERNISQWMFSKKRSTNCYVNSFMHNKTYKVKSLLTAENTFNLIYGMKSNC